jgi:hypothetical protein
MDGATSAADVVAETQQLIDERPAPMARPIWRRWAVRGVLATAAGAACVAASLVVLRRQQTRSSSHVTFDSLRKPFKLYDTSAPGCLAMPSRADQYDGIEDKRPVEIVDKDGSASVFVVGDWGATLPAHITFASNGVDGNAQITVADAMKNRAAWADPQYVLNVGDNFYVEGLQHSCNAPPNDVADTTRAAFSSAWQGIYGPLANKPWLSVLGNHDYGGWRFDKGWPQQIGYSFMNYNWIMPARYFMKRMTHPDFVVDYFMIDSNAYDAKDAPSDDHNICSAHNYGGVSTCANNGGVPNIASCKSWFWDSYAKQKQWLTDKISKSNADWKVVVTHFPCGYDSGFYKELKKTHGLDLIATGHRHQQELWKPDTKSKYVQGFLKANDWDGSAPACVVSGGGGGIVSQKFAYADYGEDLLWYGFFHLTINKKWMNIELVGVDGKVSGNWTIYPHGSHKAKQQAATKLNDGGLCASFCGDSNNPWEKVCGWMSCAACTGCQAIKV